MRRAASVTSLLLVAILALAGCGKRVNYRQDILGFIDNTYSERHAFAYTQEVEGKKALVRGKLDDGFRYQAVLNEEGSDVIEAVVDDDSIALRVINPAALPELNAGTLSTIVTDALRSGQWVVDPAGAPPIGRVKTVTSDPVRNAVTVVSYLRVAVQEAQDARLWRADDIEPAYRPFEDHFPKPDEKNGVRRYDLARILIPKPSAQAGGLDVLPKASMFRKMAFYVKAEKVIRVMEEIDIDNHFDFVDARRKNKTKMLDLLRGIKSGQGEEKIIPRKMSIAFSQLGSESITVRQPVAALTASLRGFFGIGVAEKAESLPIPTGEETPGVTPTVEPTQSPTA